MTGERHGAVGLHGDFYKDVFRYAIDAQMVLDHEGVLQDVNESCVRLFDAEDRGDLVSRHFTDFLPGWEADRARQRFKAAIAGSPKLNTFTIRTLSGAQRIVEVLGTPVDGREHRCLALVLRDVTERERRARARDLVGAIATAANEAHTDVDLGEAAVQAAHDILGARLAMAWAAGNGSGSPQMLGALGPQNGGLTSSPAKHFFDDGGLAQEAFRQGRPIHVENLQASEFTGRLRELAETHDLGSAIAAPGTLGDEHLAVLLVVKGRDEPFHPGDADLVQQAAQQIAIWLERHRLLDRLQRMNRARSTAMRQLEAQRSELESFTYTVSHDLKEPLRAVEVFTKILADEYANEMPDEASDMAERASRNATRMRGMLDDILRLSRATTRPGALTVVDVMQVVEDVKLDLQVRLRERNAHVHVSEPLPAVRADATRVREVFSNLIGNALKFNDKEVPEIRVESDGAVDHLVKFRVADNGPGIPPEEYDRVFELFHRGSAGANATGSGAGLAIVKRILASYGGDIWITPRRGGGTVFHFTLPEANEPEDGRKS